MTKRASSHSHDPPKVIIIGLGLIGGSVALAIRASHHVHIIGIDIHEPSLQMAKSLDIIDEGHTSISTTVQDADLIVIATPVSKTMELLASLARHPLKVGMMITDVGSTKETVVTESERLFNEHEVTFIGGHPMAGSHKSGVQGSRPDLFENAFYILTPGKNVDTFAVERLKRWLIGTNARFIELEAEQHDLLAGSVSHLPHIVAASLVHQLIDLKQHHPVLSDLAAGGFRDITRIASANPIMWRDILVHNKHVLIPMMERWQADMQTVQNLIEEGDDDRLQQFFSEAKRHRDELPAKKKGAIPAFYDLFVDVPDHPGVISEVTGILADHDISITNIRIMETREDIMGVLRLSFRKEADRQRGLDCLEAEQFNTYISE
ncbi:prephenate dehydrogenase [Natribacillus halophilus]|uniref:Prephenate dehydrogenase n=1 Tax=Natribacillus halophilus TaxID=549003 RepID=A0A1G8JBS2_9BACI|nr:prephenate dehydrogenase [Natribacillus halophilus]SDI28533.1 prephenate dehydrogenase [Natribacillus halophilus]